MLPISAQPRHNGVTCRPVAPRTRRGNSVTGRRRGCSDGLITLTYRAAMAASSGQQTPADLVRMEVIVVPGAGVGRLRYFALRVGGAYALCGENGRQVDADEGSGWHLPAGREKRPQKAAADPCSRAPRSKSPTSRAARSGYQHPSGAQPDAPPDRGPEYFYRT